MYSTNVIAEYLVCGFDCCNQFMLAFFTVANIESEIRRLHGRKLFTESHQNVSASSSSSSIASKDQPLFTMKQVTMICQRMLKEREETLKAEYDKILSAKLLGTCVFVLLSRSIFIVAPFFSFTALSVLSLLPSLFSHCSFFFQNNMMRLLSSVMIK